MFEEIRSPGIISVGSSERGENSYSHHIDMDLGVYIVDRFTYYTLQFLNNNREKVKRRDKISIQNMFDSYYPHLLHSRAGWNSTLDRYAPFVGNPLLSCCIVLLGFVFRELSR